MFSALNGQNDIYSKFRDEHYLCSNAGSMFDASNVRIRVWFPALKKAGIDYREMKRTRHSFAAYHLFQGKKTITDC